MLVEKLEAVLLISPNAKALRDFYINCLEFPLEDEEHEGVPLHYTCKVGNIHFAIHTSGGWPGEPNKNSQSPTLVFNSRNIQKLQRKLQSAGTDVKGPTDHGFAEVLSFRDPDGNLVEILQPKNKHK